MTLDRLARSFHGSSDRYLHDKPGARRLILFDPAETPFEADPGAQDRERPDDLTERYRLMKVMAGHFGAIRPKRRLPLVLSILHGYTVPEVAAILDISFDAAKKRLHRGRQDLLRRLRKDPYCLKALKEMRR